MWKLCILEHPPQFQSLNYTLSSLCYTSETSAYWRRHQNLHKCEVLHRLHENNLVSQVSPPKMFARLLACNSLSSQLNMLGLSLWFLQTMADLSEQGLNSTIHSASWNMSGDSKLSSHVMFYLSLHKYLKVIIFARIITMHLRYHSVTANLVTDRKRNCRVFSNSLFLLFYTSLNHSIPPLSIIIPNSIKLFPNTS